MLYIFINKLIEDKKFAMYSALFYVTSFPVIYWGLGILGDIGSWFFIILSSYLITSIVNSNFERRRLILGAVVTGIGVLYKTTVGCVAVFFTLLLLINSNKTEKSVLISSWVKFATISFVPLLINQLYIAEFWNLGYDSFVTEKFSNPDLTAYPALKLTYTYKLYTFLIAFPIVPISFLGLWNAKNHINKINFLYLCLLFLSCLLMVLLLSRNIASPRWTFILFPSIYAFFAIGLRKFHDIINIRFSFNTDYFFILILSLNFLLSLIVSLYDGEVRNALGFWPKTF